MRRGKRLQSNIMYLLAGFLVALLLGPMVGRLYMKDSGGNNVAQGSEMAQDSSMVLTKVHHEAVRDGALDWILEAASAQLQDMGRKGRFFRLNISLFDADKSETKVNAQDGNVDFVSNDFTLENLVRVTNQSYVLTSDKVVYTNAQKMLRSPGAVKVEGPSLDVVADSMEYDLEKKEAMFKGNVVAIIGGT
ncbi:MAG: LPS export ABC transporter periplasmic protein LptC [Desulfatibacillum sp.]|nr:LPS export ABC transporter periplasmic protein LptC [Desulfatibacillum sp.]